MNAMTERPISTMTKPDPILEMTLRPSLFSEFTGQAKVKERLEIAVEAAKQRAKHWITSCSTVRPAWVKPP